MATDGIKNDSISKMISMINSGEIKPKKSVNSEIATKLSEYFNTQNQNSLSKIRDEFKTDVQDINKRGLNGRQVASTEVLDEKNPNGDRITLYKDADGNVLYEKRVAHNGSREKVTYYDNNNKPTIGYEAYSSGSISGFKEVAYIKGKETVLWQTK